MTCWLRSSTRHWRWGTAGFGSFDDVLLAALKRCGRGQAPLISWTKRAASTSKPPWPPSVEVKMSSLSGVLATALTEEGFRSPGIGHHPLH